MANDGCQTDRELLTGIQSQPPGYQYHQHALEKIEDTDNQAERTGSRPPEIAPAHLLGALFPDVYPA
jgi:hypothetical protein